MNFFDFLLDLVFPRQCVSCGKWGQFICEECQKKIQYFTDQVCPYCERQSPYGLTHSRCQKPTGLNGMFVLAHYRGPIREALRKAKYQGIYGLFRELGNLLTANYHNQFDFDYFVPVPLHLNRERERGFNQAEKLASVLTQTMVVGSEIKDRKIVMRSEKKVVNMLTRIRETRPQFGLKGKERQENVIGAFALSNRPLPANCSVCLVDDVATTGATIFECAKVLKRAGAKKVWAICMARGG